MKKTMKKAMAAMMAVAALTGAVASTTNVFALSDSWKVLGNGETREVTVADGGAYLYDDPDTMNVLKYLEPGTEIGIIGDVVEGGVLTGWYAIESEDYELAYILGSDFYEYSYYSNQAEVRVSTGYLALRTAPAYDEANEIGELYTGDVVEVEDITDNGYAYVYSYKYDAYGYANVNYLFYL